jgi:DNA-binding NtrC family response regulator
MTEYARILVIDDDLSIRKTLSAALEDEGYIVDVAKNGREAIRKSKSHFYNLALIDIRLPDIDGTELLTEMKDTVPKMLKIIVTGYPGLQNAIDAVNRGADAYVVKPFKMDDLLKTVREQLQEQELARKHSEERVREFVEARVAELERKASK